MFLKQRCFRREASIIIEHFTEYLISFILQMGNIRVEGRCRHVYGRLFNKKKVKTAADPDQEDSKGGR